MGWFKIGKGVSQDIYCHSAYLTYMQNTLGEMRGQMNHKLESKTAERNISNLKYADNTTLMAESEEELQSFLMKVKEESETCVCLVIRSCPTLCNSIDCSQSGSSVHGMSQARILEWVSISFSRRPSPPRDQTHICFGRNG